jgi:hypothetical protein
MVAMKRADGGRLRLQVQEWLALVVILAVLVYSAYHVKGQDLKDLQKFVGSETKALEFRVKGSE